MRRQASENMIVSVCFELLCPFMLNTVQERNIMLLSGVKLRLKEMPYAEKYHFTFCTGGIEN